MYNQTQVDKYLDRIKFPRNLPIHPQLESLTTLQKHQLANVPFENLYLHYAKHPIISLQADDLYHKIVIRGRGGYCMENNAFFGNMLRSIGFTVYNAGGRVSLTTIGQPGGGFLGFNHMVNIVTIAKQRYLIDVGFGADGPVSPFPLISGHIQKGFGPQLMKLEYKSLPQHTDPNQRVWVYSHRENDGVDWIDAYSFPEIEFFPEDYEIMNLSTMKSPTSFFTYKVLCMKAILTDDGDAEGWLILFENSVKKRVGRSTNVLEELKSEEQRVKALEKWFGVVMNEDEKKGIVGTATELRG